MNKGIHKTLSKVTSTYCRKTRNINQSLRQNKNIVRLNDICVKNKFLFIAKLISQTLGLLFLSVKKIIVFSKKK